jgi:hypothetical protein
MITDEELTALALSADPDQPLDPDAVPFTDADGAIVGLLPAWYMPRPIATVHRAWHTPVVITIIAALTLITGLGLCITYGTLVVA